MGKTFSRFLVIFDVEASCVNGRGFAYGYVVLDTETGSYVEEGIQWAVPDWTGVSADDQKWVQEHVCKNMPDGVTLTIEELHSEFWEMWARWSDKGAWLVADCLFPVETNWLAECLKEDPTRSKHQPYPVLDVVTALAFTGHFPMADYPRQDDELPKHNPLADARQSARILWERVIQPGKADLYSFNDYADSVLHGREAVTGVKTAALPPISLGIGMATLELRHLINGSIAISRGREYAEERIGEAAGDILRYIAFTAETLGVSLSSIARYNGYKHATVADIKIEKIDE